MNRVFILDKICLNVDNETDAQNLINQGAREVTDLSIFKGYENLASPQNTVVNDDGSITFTAPQEKTLEELKADKLNELASITSKYDNQLVNTDMIIKSSLGFKVNADLRSQNNLRGLIAVGVEPVNFMTADNSVKTLTLAELNTLLKETIQNGEHLYRTKWGYRDKINNAQSIDELNAIQFNFVMKDFSNVSA